MKKNMNVESSVQTKESNVLLKMTLLRIFYAILFLFGAYVLIVPIGLFFIPIIPLGKKYSIYVPHFDEYFENACSVFRNLQRRW